MLFSIIIPVYNVGQYLWDCLNSVRSQSFSDFEVILVDDGSSDNSGNICDAVAEKDSRFCVIHKENGGLVSARKAGIQQATGEYVVNLDSDDMLAPDALLYAVDILEQNKVDLISFAISFFGENQSYTVCEPYPIGYYNKQQIEKNIFPKMLMAKNMQHGFYYLCAKVIKREILIQPQLSVDDGISLGEDVTCLMQVYPQCSSVYISEQVTYLCRLRLGSDSRAFKPVQLQQLALVIQSLEKNALYGQTDFSAQIHRYTAFTCFGILNVASGEGKRAFLPYIKQALKNPLFTRHIKSAQFEHITLKMKMIYALLKHNAIATAYGVIQFCNFLKRGKSAWH